jgi:hypothetical protein
MTWLAPNGRSDGLTSELLAWRAGRRALVRVRTGSKNSRGVCVKVFRRLMDSRGQTLHENLAAHFARRSGGLIQLADILDVRADSSSVITREIEDARSLTGTPADVAAAARTLVCLHSAPLRLQDRHTPRDELQTVCRWLRALRAASEPAHRRLRSDVRRLVALLYRIDSAAACPVHRDFYAAQLLRRGETVWLTDLDTLADGDAEVDVATFAAHLALDALLAGEGLASAGEAVAGFVAEYRAWGGTIDVRRLNFYLGSALLRLGALHGARGRPAGIVDSLWSMADDRIRGIEIA